jgi:hypothetical protein
MIDTIKDIFIVLYFQQNPCLSIKKYAVHNIHRLAWELYARDVPGQLARMTTLFLKKNCISFTTFCLFICFCINFIIEGNARLLQLHVQ